MLFGWDHHAEGGKLMPDELSIAIVGAGIGGLCAALCLLQAGFDVHVYEQSTSFGEVGGGLQISPNASRILHRLGLAAALSPSVVRARELHQRRWDDGRTLLRIPLGDVAEKTFGAPHFHVHRAELLAALAHALPVSRLHLGQRLAGFAPAGDRVELQFESGLRVTADVLVGADGIRSQVRQALLGADPARFTGCVAYRGLVPAECLEDVQLDLTMQIWLGPHRHFVHYFVARERLLNFVAVIERGSWTGESWMDRGNAQELLGEFAGWHAQVRSILSQAREPFVWALFDRPPLTRWSFGAVTLLGDACHPMLPSFGQGAAQSIEDGATLAACLSARGGASVSDALLRYEALRLPRTARVQELSTQNRDRFQLPDGPAQRERDARLASAGPDPAVGWLFKYDAWAAATVVE